LKGEEIQWILNLRGGSIDIGERKRKFWGPSLVRCMEKMMRIFLFLGELKGIGGSEK
jgi:hypothetical protein